MMRSLPAAAAEVDGAEGAPAVHAWRPGDAAAPAVSVIVPALDEEESIGAAVASALAQDPPPREVLVVDGESGDRTRDEAEAAGARVLAAPRGRGSQLAAGAAAAQGDLLVFLHADTRLPAGALAGAVEAAAGGAAGGRFRLRFDRRHPVLDLIAFASRFPGSWASFGDSVLFATREAYRRAGGFEPVPLFEDVRFYARLRRTGPVRVVPLAVTTSARRFLRDGPGRRLMANVGLFLAHRLGASPHRLALRYRGRAGGR